MWRRFLDFYETTYLKDHAKPLNRWVHFLSNLSAISCLTAGLVTQSWSLFALGVWFQLGPPYLGHILFEGSHASIDRSPIFSAMGSWYTTSQILLRRQSVTWGRERRSQQPSSPLSAASEQQAVVPATT